MIYIVGLLIVLCLAVALNFAMLGQLAARVNATAPAGPSGPRPVDDFVAGRPVTWPTAPTPPHQYVVVVLSTACASCRRLATEMAERQFLDSTAEAVRVLISTSRTEIGTTFAEELDLARFAPYIDERGELARTSLGIEMSPTVVAVTEGVTTTAFIVETVDHITQVMASLSRPAAPSNALITKGQGR